MTDEREIPISVLVRYFRVPVQALPVDYPGRELLLGSSITNISANGVFIRTQKPLSLGTTLEVAFKLPDSGDEIRGSAAVRWIKQDGSGESPGMGLEFVKLPRKSQRKLERFVKTFLTRMRKQREM